MAVQFFGQFLLAERLLSAEQLVAAVAHRQAEVKKLQAFLLEKGILTPQHLAQIAVVQATRGTPRFLDAARELSLITEAQADEAANAVGFSHVYLGESAVALGLLTAGALEAALERFHAAQREPDKDRADIPGDLPQRAFCVAVAELVVNLLGRVWGVPAKPRPAEIHAPVRRERFLGHTASFGLGPSLGFVVAVPPEVASAAAEHLALVGAPAQPATDLVTQLAEMLVQRAMGIAGLPQILPTDRALDEIARAERALVLPTATSLGEVVVALAGV